MSKKTLVLICVLFLAAAGLLYVAFRSVGTNSGPYTTTMPATPTPFAQTTLSMSSSKTAQNTIDVNVQSGGNVLTATQINIQYDPKAITVTKISPGPFFAKPVIFPQTIDAENGTLSYALGIAPTGEGHQGDGTIATISYTPTLAAGQTILSFTPESLVTAVGQKASVLKDTQPVTITIGSAPQN